MSEKQKIKLGIFINFLEKKYLSHIKATLFVLISPCSFEGVRYFWVELCIFFSKLLSATNQQLFCVTESDIGKGPSNHTPPLYELLVSVY